MNQSKMDEVINRIAAQMSLEFMRDNLEKIRHCVATGAPIIIKDGELIDPNNMYSGVLNRPETGRKHD
jgi:hypothetical protein